MAEKRKRKYANRTSSRWKIHYLQQQRKKRRAAQEEEGGSE